MLGRYYVQYNNYCYRRTGTVFEGRYKATLIDSESYLLTCMRYIELNPVRAGMTGDPAGYPWSSYHYNVLGHAEETWWCRMLNTSAWAQQTITNKGLTVPYSTINLLNSAAPISVKPPINPGFWAMTALSNAFKTSLTGG